MGDITKPQYVMRRQTMEEELQRTTPPADPDLDRAQALLEDFARFWDAEPQPVERHRLLHSLFAQVWAKDGRIVAVKPHTAFAPYFTAALPCARHAPAWHSGKRGNNSGSDGGQTLVRHRIEIRRRQR